MKAILILMPIIMIISGCSFEIATYGAGSSVTVVNNTSSTVNLIIGGSGYRVSFLGENSKIEKNQISIAPGEKMVARIASYLMGSGERRRIDFFVFQEGKRGARRTWIVRGRSRHPRQQHQVWAIEEHWGSLRFR